MLLVKIEEESTQYPARANFLDSSLKKTALVDSITSAIMLATSMPLRSSSKLELGPPLGTESILHLCSQLSMECASSDSKGEMNGSLCTQRSDDLTRKVVRDQLKLTSHQLCLSMAKPNAERLQPQKEDDELRL